VSPITTEVRVRRQFNEVASTGVFLYPRGMTDEGVRERESKPLVESGAEDV
jgi:hypothetical protein